MSSMIDQLMKFLGAGGAGAAGAGTQAAGIAQNLAASGVDDFVAADAANLASQGIGEAAIAQNLGAAGVEDADFIAADAQGLAGAMAQPGGGFDYKGMLESLGKNLGEQAKANKPTISPVDTSARGAGQASAPIMLPTGMGQGQSGAMQAIQGMIGGQPSREQLMKMMMGA